MKLYISGIREIECLKGVELLTESRRARIDRYVRFEDKARCLIAGLLLRRVCGVTDDFQLTYGAKGKPYLKDGGAFFSISHSGDYVVLATSDSEVGVDIEKVANYSDSVAARCFTPQELKWMRSSSCRDTFHRLWTAKESIMKGTGLGFSLPPEAFSVIPEDSSAIFADDRYWSLDWLSYDGYIICRAEECNVYAELPRSGKATALSPCFITCEKLLYQ